MTTLQNVPCRLEAIAGDVTDITGGVIDDIKGGTDLTGDGARPARPPEKATRPRPAPRASTPAASRAPRETPFTVVGVPALRLPRPDGKLPAAAQPDLSSLLPQPHVAAAPQPRAAAPEGQLVTPMSGTEQQNTQMLAVAVAAGLAGAVGALNLSVAGRRSRRPRT
jgi:hypothetical protein